MSKKTPPALVDALIEANYELAREGFPDHAETCKQAAYEIECWLTVRYGSDWRSGWRGPQTPMPHSEIPKEILEAALELTDACDGVGIEPSTLEEVLRVARTPLPPVKRP